MFRALSFVALAAMLSAQSESPPPRRDVVPPTAPAATVPTFPNSTCPVMGKKVSMKLFTDTEYGRIYICCKGCDKKIQKDVATAYKTAYPTTKALANTTCPVTGVELGAAAVEITLQGHSLRLCSVDCVPVAKRNAQIVLTLASDRKRTDLRNATCPIAGTAVADNAFVLIGDTVVRLSSPSVLDAVSKDPAGALAKARAVTTLPDPRQTPASPASQPKSPPTPATAAPKDDKSPPGTDSPRRNAP